MPAAYDQILVKGTARYRKDKQFIAKDNVPDAVKESSTLTNVVDENGLEIVTDKGDYGNDKPVAGAPTPDPFNADDDTVPEDDPAAPDDGPEAPADPPATDRPSPKVPKASEPVLPDAPESADGLPGTPDAVASGPEADAQAIADTPVRKFTSRTPQSDPGMGFPRVKGKTVDIFDGKTPHTHTRLVAGHTVPLSAKNFRQRTDAEIEDRLRELGKEVIDYNKFETGPDSASEGSDDDLADDTV